MAETTKKRTYKKKTTTATETAVQEEAVKAVKAEEPVAPPDPPAPEPQTFTKEQVQDMIAQAVADAIAKQQATPQIVQITADTEKVHFLWQAEVSDENVYEVGPNGMYGRIVGKTGSFLVPKSDLSRVMDAMFRLMLQRRWIIAVDGLTDAEREAYGVDYKEGEVLDEKGFAKMVELGDGIIEIYPKLCVGHREMVAKRYHEAFINHSQYVTRERVVELNRLSKQLGSKNKDGDFYDIIEAMNAADLD